MNLMMLLRFMANHVEEPILYNMTNGSGPLRSDTEKLPCLVKSVSSLIERLLKIICRTLWKW